VRPRLNFLIAIGELGISANAVLQLQQQTSSSVHNLDKLFQADSIARPVASVAAGLQCHISIIGIQPCCAFLDAERTSRALISCRRLVQLELSCAAERRKATSTLQHGEGKPALLSSVSSFPCISRLAPSDDDNVKSCLLFPTESTMNEDQSVPGFPPTGGACYLPVFLSDNGRAHPR
jgi:hypothetical protein